MDYVTWTETLAEKFAIAAGILEERYPDKQMEVWVEGGISELARDHFGELDWVVMDKASIRLQ